MSGKRLMVPVDSRVVLGAVSKGRSSSRKMNFLLRKLGFWCLAYDIALERVWVPTWANPPDAPSRNRPLESWYASLPKLLPPPPMPSRSWIYSLNHSQQLSVRQKNKYVNSNPPAPSVRKRNRPVENAGPQMICVGEDNSVHKGESVEARGAADYALPLCWLRHEPVSVVPSGFRTPPGLALPMGS